MDTVSLLIVASLMSLTPAEGKQPVERSYTESTGATIVIKETPSHISVSEKYAGQSPKVIVARQN